MRILPKASGTSFAKLFPSPEPSDFLISSRLLLSISDSTFFPSSSIRVLCKLSLSFSFSFKQTSNLAWISHLRIPYNSVFFKFFLQSFDFHVEFFRLPKLSFISAFWKVSCFELVLELICYWLCFLQFLCEVSIIFFIECDLTSDKVLWFWGLLYLKFLLGELVLEYFISSSKKRVEVLEYLLREFIEKDNELELSAWRRVVLLK